MSLVSSACSLVIEKVVFWKSLFSGPFRREERFLVIGLLGRLREGTRNSKSPPFLLSSRCFFLSNALASQCWDEQDDGA
jgi:hypothetical protein